MSNHSLQKVGNKRCECPTIYHQKQSLCLSISDRERKKCGPFFSFFANPAMVFWPGLCPLWRETLLPSDRLEDFNAHFHNSICVCDFPFGKLWVLPSHPRLYLRQSNHHEPNDTVAHCDCAVIAQLHICTCTHAKARKQELGLSWPVNTWATALCLAL